VKKSLPVAAASAVLFLFFIQAAGTLVASIYILDLMHTSLDAKALGVLAFFAAVLLLPFRGRVPAWLTWILVVALVIARSVLPFLPTLGRLYASGAALAVAILLLPFLLSARPRGGTSTAAAPAAGFALAVGLSGLLRSVGFGVDWSLAPAGGWVGPVLGAILIAAATRLDAGDPREVPSKGRGVTLPVVGVFGVLALAWFAFSAPSVISRWTQSGYVPVVAAVSLLSLGWVALSVLRPRTLEMSRGALAAGNALFLIGLVATLLVHRVAFPSSPDAGAVVVGAASLLQQLPLVLMLLAFPVLFADLRVFFSAIADAAPSPRRLAPGLLLGGLLLVLLVFASVFTNVWGYIGPASTPFRNQFWLPFAVAALVAGLTAVLHPAPARGHGEGDGSPRAAVLAVSLAALAAMLAATVAFAAVADRPASAAATEDRRSLRLMTYNIQAGNDGAAERAVDRQLEVIRAAAPDIVALQESDTARVGLNNDDYVRYFAAKLGWHAWYGPATVTGTFGTAILSRWPIRSPRVCFTFSDTDEVGTAEAEIVVGGRTFTIYNVHPDGHDAAMLAFARTLVQRAAGRAGVIVLGDFNIREGDETWPMLEAAFTEAWSTVYPSRIGPDGVDMKRRIDHVMVSRDLGVRDPVYVLPPRSATDHPVHWTDVTW